MSRSLVLALTKKRLINWISLKYQEISKRKGLFEYQKNDNKLKNANSAPAINTNADPSSKEEGEKI